MISSYHQWFDGCKSFKVRTLLKSFGRHLVHTTSKQHYSDLSDSLISPPAKLRPSKFGKRWRCNRSRHCINKHRTRGPIWCSPKATPFALILPYLSMSRFSSYGPICTMTSLAAPGTKVPRHSTTPSSFPNTLKLVGPLHHRPTCKPNTRPPWTMMSKMCSYKLAATFPITMPKGARSVSTTTVIDTSNVTTENCNNSLNSLTSNKPR